jgi:6-phosphogluconolactonase
MSRQSEFNEFDSRDRLVVSLGERIAGILESAVVDKGVATVAVSGGSTPKRLFEYLSSIDIPWQRINITLVDERWVEPDSLASNERLIREYLLQNRAANAAFHGLKTSAPDAEIGAAECEKRLSSLPFPFDVTVLGMGSDGHTASLFPGSPGLDTATDMHSRRRYMKIIPPAAPYERITMTLPAILASSNLFLHIEGSEKRDVYNRACAGDNDIESKRRMPVRYVLFQRDVQVFWAP